jgi:hypothetical protein
MRCVPLQQEFPTTTPTWHPIGIGFGSSCLHRRVVGPLLGAWGEPELSEWWPPTADRSPFTKGAFLSRTGEKVLHLIAAGKKAEPLRFFLGCSHVVDSVAPASAAGGQV